MNKITNEESQARTKISQLEELMAQAQAKNLDIEREKATLWFADQFLNFANYDEKHLEDHIRLFKSYGSFEQNAVELGKNLPYFERTDVIKMLNTSIDIIQKVISGEFVRKPVNKVDWTGIKVKNGQFYNGNNHRPIFLYDYFSKTFWGSHNDTNVYNDYLGDIASPPYIGLSLLKNESGDLHDDKFDPLTKQEIPDSIDCIVNYETIYPHMKDHIGNMILWHGSEFGYNVLPQWALDKHGKDKLFHMSSSFTAYDVDSPHIRQMWTTLFDNLIPQIKGKNFTKLGYILANEPHWYVDTESWGTVKNDMGEHTHKNFQKWLKNKHNNDIKEFNILWNTSHKSFSDVKFSVPFATKKYNGTPLLYDWARFNMAHINNWFQFLHDGIKKNDPDAHTHVKISSVFADIDSVRTNGIDPESLTNITDFIGNDVKIRKRDDLDDRWNEYDEKYAYYWRDVAMSYALYSSFGPNKINVNSESHFISTSRFRDLYLEPKYVRSAYWLATILGMNANLTWYWARNGDGSFESRIKASNGDTDKFFPATNAEMPRATNEYLQTMYDLNAHSEDIIKFQRQIMPIRIFYSETTSINRREHIAEMFHILEKLYFEGISIGFATEKILNNKTNDINNTNFDDLVIYKTTNATLDEFKSVQDYLNRGGTVIIDNESFKLDEYNRPHTQTLTQGKGKLIIIKDNTLENMAQSTLKHVQPNHMPSISLHETNDDKQKGVIWRIITRDDDSKVLTAMNVGKTTAKLNLLMADNNLTITNLITGQTLSKNIELESEGTLFLEIK